MSKPTGLPLKIASALRLKMKSVMSSNDLINTFAFGMPPWKERLAARFPGRRFVFISSQIAEKKFNAQFKRRILAEPQSEIFAWSTGLAPHITAFIEQNNLKCTYLDNGFIHSIEPTAAETPSFSLLLDSVPHHDATKPSDLERLLNEYDFASDEALLTRARKIMSSILDAGLSRYNDAPLVDIESVYGAKTSNRVLVLGESEKKNSISNEELLRFAATENPDSQIIFIPHASMFKKGGLSFTCPADLKKVCLVPKRRIRIAQALKTIDHVYTIASLDGFEALMRGIKVTTLGSPFYSGWGLTDDRQPNERRSRALSLEELFAAAYLLYPKYYDELDKEITPDGFFETALSRPLADKELDDSAKKDTMSASSLFFAHVGSRSLSPMLPSAYMLGFVEHKVPFFADELTDYNTFALNMPVAEQQGLSPASLFGRVELGPNDVIVVWGRKDPPGLRQFAASKSIPIHRVEDAFIRSIDLGGVHGTPLSYIYDETGIYFDAEQPSDLELLLSEYDFKADTTLMARARACIEHFLRSGTSKYNFADRVDIASFYGEKTDKRILVIGQVEDDASIQYGCSRRITNNDLVTRARLENPDAQIIYKPHPDVLLGLRKRISDPTQVESIAQVLYESVPIADALETIDHVYTITSLAGFEALLRGIKVTAFGAPFYSGWGLTDDRQPVPRRGRTLEVAEIFAAAYILYPRYLNPINGERIEIEEAMSLLEWMKSSGIQPSGIHDDERVSGILIKRSKKALEAANIVAAKRFADFAVSANSSAAAYCQRAHVNLMAGSVGEVIERDYLVACNLGKWNDLESMMAYAKYLWEFSGTTKEFYQVVSRLRKIKMLSAGQKMTIAAMLHSCGYYNAAIDLCCEAIRNQTEPLPPGYIELCHTLNKVKPGDGLNMARATEIRKHLKEETLKFAGAILDSRGDFCVVGNSPKEIGTGNGPRIDSHKIVIRFNSYSVDYPFNKDYGNRTDIWIRMPRNVGLTDRVDPSIKQVIVSGSNWPHRMPDGIWFFSNLLDDFSSVGVVPFDVYKRLVSELKSVPSGGLQILYWVYSLTGPIPRECVYGFELTDQPKHKDLQYGATSQRVVRHNWERERALFDRMIAQ